MQRVRYSRGALIILLIVVMIFFKTISLLAAYDSTYVLAVKQKYAIPENVENGDYVGKWLKTWTWKSQGTISYNIEKNYHDAFAINTFSGTITINNAAYIKNKIVKQDTIINIIIRTSDSEIGSELDTAQIFVKELSFCKFVDYNYCGVESATKENPQNDLDDLVITPGYGYFIKRGTIIKNEYTPLTSHLASQTHPTIFSAYGKGNKPIFTSGTNICFYIGDTSGGNGDPDDTRSENIYFFDLQIRDYASAAFYCRRKSNNIGWYNIDIINCDINKTESNLAINTSFPDNGSIGDSSAIYNFEILNCIFDSTYSTNFIKDGVGPTLITNCYFGLTEDTGKPLRLTAGHGSIVKHCLFEPGTYNKADDNVANIQCRQDRVLIEDCIFNNLGTGVYITNPGTAGPEVQPDSITIRNCFFKGQGFCAILISPTSVEDNPGYGHVFEDNYMVNVANGIELRDCINATIQRNKIIGGNGSGIKNGKSEPSKGTKISYNIIHSFNEEEIQMTYGYGTKIYNNIVIGSINCFGAIEVEAYNNYAYDFNNLETDFSNIDIDTISVSNHFVDFENQDFRLKATASSALNKGLDLEEKYDYAGNPILDLPEIGAFEYYNNLDYSNHKNSPPVVFNQEFVIEQKDFSNLYIGKVIAYDNDKDQKIKYSIINGNESGLFILNSESGELKITNSNVFDSKLSVYILTVSVMDDGTIPKSQSANIKVTFIGQSSTIYIDPDNNNDPEEDGSLNNPYNSWQDITWTTGNIYLQKCGTIAHEEGIIIGANNVTLGSYGEGELPVIISETSNYLIRGFEKENIIISNLSLESPNAVSCIYFLGASCNNITIEHCHLEGVTNGIRIVSGLKVAIKYNTIYCENTGISSTAELTEVYYNIFKSNQVAINIPSTSSEANIFNNVFFSNNESVSASYGELNLFNNIFYMTSSGQRALKYLSDKIYSDHNIYYPEQNGFIEIAQVTYSTLTQLQQNNKLDLNSFTSDPKFMDIYNDNYELDNTSPAIDAGKDLNLAKDFFGQSVPISYFPDIGIFEFNKSTLGSSQMSSVESMLIVYPNPSTGFVNVDVQPTNPDESEVENLTKNNQSTIIVKDISGKTLLTRIVESTENIIHENLDLSSLTNGIYFIIFEILGRPISEKIVINR